ncbi:glutathione S-transferase N-terminal domain-containing protein [Salmonella enterica subsp. enterica]|nr:glutathione S-transferase N-terminal domain-containing protein [Salmonella enterica subsp. enterica]
MKLIGSYTSPFVRKISVLLLEKGVPSNLLMNYPTRRITAWRNTTLWVKVPALVTEKRRSIGSIRRSSRNIYIELCYEYRASDAPA